MLTFHTQKLMIVLVCLLISNVWKITILVHWYLLNSNNIQKFMDVRLLVHLLSSSSTWRIMVLVHPLRVTTSNSTWRIMVLVHLLRLTTLVCLLPNKDLWLTVMAG
jgi:hypothetical protein